MQNKETQNGNAHGEDPDQSMSAESSAPAESMEAEENQEATSDLVVEEALKEAESRAAALSEEEKRERVQSLKPIIEGALMAAGQNLTLLRLQGLFDELEMPSKGLLVETLNSIREDYSERGFELIEVASGWRFQVREHYAPWVNRLWQEKPQKYSRALMETLALIAYRQPITRGDIEEVRGVAVSSHIMKTLIEREWVKVVGHRDVPGRPALYATTKQFLDYFNMKSLDELPTLGEIKDIDGLNQNLDLGDPGENSPLKAEGRVVGDSAPDASGGTSDQSVGDSVEDDAAMEVDDHALSDADNESALADEVDISGEEQITDAIHDGVDVSSEESPSKSLFES